jgi:predicted nuclease of predicted toxin-antitoxin system
MRFIVDAQLPRLLTDHLVASGHDAVHVKQLPKAGGTGDAEISAFADREHRIVVTKDTDFQESHLLRGTPTRLLRVATGNLRNSELIAPFSRHHLDRRGATALYGRPRGRPRCMCGHEAGVRRRDTALSPNVAVVAVLIDDELPVTVCWASRAKVPKVKGQDRQSVSLGGGHDRGVRVSEVKISEHGV